MGGGFIDYFDHGLDGVDMAKSNKPVFWGLFAAGGTLTAIVMPALILLTLLAAFDIIPGLLQYDNLHAFAAHWFGKLIIFAIILLSLWHAAHRLRGTLHDLGLHHDKQAAVLVYGIAAIGTLLTIVFLYRI